MKRLFLTVAVICVACLLLGGQAAKTDKSDKSTRPDPQQDRTRITLEVRETNLNAQLFFRAQNFRAVRVLRSYYEDSGEDAFLMQYRLADDTGEEFEETVNRIAQYEES